MKLMLRFFTLMLLCLLTQGLIAQTLMGTKAVPQQVIEKLQAGKEFKTVNVFNTQTRRASHQEYLNKTLEEATVLTINKNSLKEAVAAGHDNITFTLPSIERGQIEMELYKVDLIDPDYTVKTSTSNGEFVSVKSGLHYRGMIKGESQSLVAISMFEEEVMGMIVGAEGNMVLGKLEGRATDEEYVLYIDADLKAQNEFSCDTPDDGEGYTEEELAETVDTRDAGDCIKIYIEADKDIYDAKGSVQATTNYMSGVFNQCAALYANEGITYGISEIFVWTTNSPYTGSGSSNFLNKFQQQRASTFVGDLAIFCNLANGDGGVAAGFSGLCNSNRASSMSFAGLTTSYSNVPTYSWTVMVFTHELGHLMGSRHTHACVWNGNNTAIDGCAGYIEGNCSIPGYPSNGGTIMSYCHVQSVGINLNNGFGPQPGNVIRNKVNNASCLAASCGGGPVSCSENEVVVTINPDNYGSETTWIVKNAAGQTVASGGPYTDSDNSAKIETLCLPNGCYDFQINDSYGDGICCSYGTGSYSVTGAAGTLASGASFANSETTNFCVGAAAPTCDDGVQNGDEAGVDCGGSNCAPCVTCDDGIQNGDEEGVDCGGSNCPTCPEPVCTDVTFSLTFDNYASETAWQITNPAGQVIGSGSGYGDAQNNQTITASGCLDAGCYTLTVTDSYGDGICCSYGNGSYSVTVNGNVVVSGAQFGSSISEQFCVGTGSGLVNGGSTGLSPAIESSNPKAEALNLYPNPVTNQLNIGYPTKTTGEIQITVYDVLGRVVVDKTASVSTGQNTLELDVNALETGYHFIKIQDGDAQFIQKFIKN